MLLSAILVGLVLGALAGGQLPRLADLRLKWIWLLGIALAVRLAAGLAITTDSGGADVAAAWGLPVTYVLIVIWLYRNWKVPGLQVAAIGVTLNTIAVILHQGKMPVFEGALFAAGLSLADIAGDPFHIVLTADSTAEFVRQGGMFGDVVPIPIPVLRDVISIGDVLLWVGIVWAIAAAMTRPSVPTRMSVALGANPPRPMPAGEFQLGVAYATAMPLAAEPVPVLPGPGIGVAVEEEESRSRRTSASPATATTPCCGAASWSA